MLLSGLTEVLHVILRQPTLSWRGGRQELAGWGVAEGAEASLPDRGILLLLPWPAGDRGAGRGADRGPLVVHGRLCGANDRQGADADPGPHHLDRQHAHGGPARCPGRAGVRLPGALLAGWRV